MEFAVRLMKGVLAAIYAVMKLFPVKNNKIVFCSRQSSDVPLDFALIQKELARRQDGLCFVNICNRIGKGAGAYASFAADTLRSMKHMATSRVCVLDAYWPAASMLHHKEELTIIQIWHAIGKIKKSGMITAGAKTGRDPKIAALFNMHEKNDYIIAGAKAFDQFYRDSFGDYDYTLMNYGLPRIDYLIDNEEANRDRFFAENPELKGRTILLYAPTFRRGMEARWQDIIEVVDPDKYTLIIKNHPTQRIEGERPAEHVRYFDDWTAVDLLAASDYVITDYSAIALEAAVLRKKTLYWVYDYDEYVRDNGLNVDMFESMPGLAFRDAAEMMAFIDRGEYPMERLDAYRQKYLPEDLGHSAEKIAQLILDELDRKSVKGN
ncbi:MAG: CDP-glycerol glycerophosphotransferase family protein [Firmicutes bacterium]|nr:CDP-glycerol glycerophosphotransferase family protein [Bacillota bacterium]